MTKKRSIAGLVAAAAASSAFAFGTAPAKAACLTSTGTAGIPGYNPCVTFDNTATSVVDYQGFAGGGAGIDPKALFAKVGFRFSNFTPNINLTNIKLAGDGILSTLNFGNLSVTSNTSFFETSTIALNNPATGLGTFAFTNSKLSFDFPGGLASASPAGSISLRVTYCTLANCTQPDGENVIQNQRNNQMTFSPSTSPTRTPGPLPIVGAAVAFAQARRIRKSLIASA
jgi:hypothetical protein